MSQLQIETLRKMLEAAGDEPVPLPASHILKLGDAFVRSCALLAEAVPYCPRELQERIGIAMREIEKTA